MGLKFRLTVLSFLQFFIWGSWLITIGAYWFQHMQWAPDKFGTMFGTLGIASIIMPPITGIIADKWLNAEKLLGILHILGSVALFCLPMADNPDTLITIMQFNMLCYMPTISLSNAVSYSALKESNYDVVKVFPPIRVWGTIGFIVAMWTISLTHLETSATQFYVASVSSFLLGIYSFTLPKCRPQQSEDKNTILEKLGLEAITLFRKYKMVVFFFFAMMLGAALQLTNMYGDTFLHDFGKMSQYTDTLTVKYPAIIMSISQMSETLFILTIPFFLKRFGIKNVMLFSMLAWVLRFGLFSYGNPAGGLWMIILSCIIYGMAFDFFNISGSLFLETETSPKIRASAQGLFMMMTNGIGAFLGANISGWVIANYFTGANGEKMWQPIWLSFAAYALVVAVLFTILFKHKNKRVEVVTAN
jgi:NHS family xanthosine MFS transporter